MAGKRKIYIFDTTLRDGAQTEGVNFSLAEKRTIAAMLEEIGVDYIEGGWPGANPLDTKFFATPPKLKSAQLTAFGMTARAGRSAANDPGLSAVLDAKAPATCLVAKSWDYHVREVLGTDEKSYLRSISDSIERTAAKGEAMMDAEHFFDGYKANPDYALNALKAAHEAGARWIVLCDTNGGTLPSEVYDITREVAKHIPAEQLGIHAHNDTGNAVANSLAALEAGACQLQGTLNGLGERCGNANLTTLLPGLLLKPTLANNYQLSVTKKHLRNLTRIARRFDDEILNRHPNPYAPYVGRSAFAHKGGLHVSAVRKAPETYEHVPPDEVGNVRQILVSNQAGRANILDRLAAAGYHLSADDPHIARLLETVKEREEQGWAYEGAPASFELLAARQMGEVPHYFDVLSYRVITERRINAVGKKVAVSEAVVKVQIDGEVITSAGEGNGPINALDEALRADLGKYSRYIEDIAIRDYKVRILGQGSTAITRVLIENVDKKGQHWRTLGVSSNIIEASFGALVDGIIWRLIKSNAPPGKDS